MLRRPLSRALSPLAAVLILGASPLWAAGAGFAAPPAHGASAPGASAHGPGPHHRLPRAYVATPWGGTGTVNQITVVHQDSPRRDAPPQSRIGGVTSLDEMPVVAGIRRPPAGPPTVYWLQGKAERQTWFGRHPGPRILTLADVEPAPARGRGRVAPSPNAPRIIVIRAQ